MVGRPRVDGAGSRVASAGTGSRRRRVRLVVVSFRVRFQPDSLKASGGADGDVEFAAAGAGEAFEGFDSWCAGAVFPCGDG